MRWARRQPAGVAKRSKAFDDTITKSTAANLIAGTTRPRLTSVIAFLHGCDLPAHRHQPWIETHRRLFPPPPAKEPVRIVSSAPALPVASGPGWRLIPVEEFQLEQASVHGARFDPGAAAVQQDQPSYVARDHDEGLRAHLRDAAVSGGLVVLHGTSATGKSRSLYEATRTLLGGWHVLLADDADAVRRAAAHLPGRTVIWLDDTPSARYLSSGGLTRVDVLSLIADTDRDGPVVIVDMLWPKTFAHLTAAPSPRTDDTDPTSWDPWRDAREVLALAAHRVIPVADRFSDEEKERVGETARATGDRRLAEAVQDRRYGVTQHLAGAPQLIAHWERSRVVNVYAQGLLAAAIHARRLGVYRPLSVDLLTAAAATYLDSEAFAEAPSTWAQSALEYATRLLVGNVRALIPVPGTRVGEVAGYTVADYLLQHVATAQPTVWPPPGAWEALAAHTPASPDLWRLAINADDRMLYRTAETLYEPIAAQGNKYSARRLCALLVARGASDGEIEHGFRMLVDAGCSYSERWVHDSDHRAHLEALKKKDRANVVASVLRYWADAGDAEAADDWARLMMKLYRPDQAAEVIKALQYPSHDCDTWIETLLEHGDINAALQALREAKRRLNIFDLSELVDDLAAHARDRSEKVMFEEGLITRPGWYDRLVAQGATDAAMTVLRTLAPLTERATALLADVLLDSGHTEEALQAFLDHANDPAHSSLARWGSGQRHAALLIKLGRLDEVESRADQGDNTSQHAWAGILRQQGRFGALARRAEAGDREAASVLAYNLQEWGHLDAAIAVLREVDGPAGILGLLKAAGRHDEVLRILQDLLRRDPDDYTPAAWAGSLAAEGDPDGLAMVMTTLEAGAVRPAHEMVDVLIRRSRTDAVVPEAVVRALFTDRSDDPMSWRKWNNTGHRWIELLIAAGRRDDAQKAVQVAIDAGGKLDASWASWLLEQQFDLDTITAVLMHPRCGHNTDIHLVLRPLLEAGRHDEAVTIARALVASSDIPDRAREQASYELAKLLADLGEFEDLWELADSQHGDSARRIVIELLAGAGLYEDLTPYVLQGDSYAGRRLLDHLYENGRVADAEKILRQAADSGVAWAAEWLAHLAVARMSPDELTLWARQGHPVAADVLVRALQRAGAIGMLCSEIDAGTPGAAQAYLTVLRQAGYRDLAATLARNGRQPHESLPVPPE